jgi:hypothetical protein
MRRGYQTSKIQLSEKDLLELKPRINRVNSRFEFEPYEYDKGIYVIDVKGITGGIDVEEDLLVSNWWALLMGLLRKVNAGDSPDTGGTARTLRTLGIVNYSAAYLSYGTGTTPESFIDYSLKSKVGSISTSFAVGYMSDRTRVTLSGVVPASASELGIEQQLYDNLNYTYIFLLGRRTGSWSQNQAVSWYIDFLNPWVRGIGDFMYGILRYTNVTMVRVDGVSFTARTTGETQSGSAYLVASSDVVTWYPTLYAISNAFSLSMYYADILSSRYIRATILHGLYSPANDITVNTVGLYFPVYDTTGSSQTVCVLVQPLSSSITLYAGRNNLIVLRLLAV